jgi:hypothetical protein
MAPVAHRRDASAFHHYADTESSLVLTKQKGAMAEEKIGITPSERKCQKRLEEI